MFARTRRETPGLRSSLRPTRELQERIPGPNQDPIKTAVEPLSVDLHTVPLWNPATGRPEVTDVQQGHVGSCWALAVLAAFAHTAPEKLMSRVRLQYDGRYRVYLDRPIEVGSFVDAYRPALGRPVRPMYAAYERAAWVAIMEKAIARRDPAHAPQGSTATSDESYDRIHGGKSTMLMDVLGWRRGGIITFTHDILPDPTTTLSCIAQFLADRKLVTAGLRFRGGNHSFAVLSCTPTTIHLYDPHGSTRDMAADEFAAEVTTVCVSGQYED